MLKINMSPLPHLAQGKGAVKSAEALAIAVPELIRYWLAFAFAKLVLSTIRGSERVVGSINHRAKLFARALTARPWPGKRKRCWHGTTNSQREKDPLFNAGVGPHSG